MSKTVFYSTTLTAIECGECAIPFALPANLLDSLQENGSLFYCPNGHHISYSETENQRLRRQLASAEGATAAARARALQEKRCAAAARGQLTKVKNRVARGVCPCCNRHFVNVERHMATQHPDFSDS